MLTRRIAALAILVAALALLFVPSGLTQPSGVPVALNKGTVLVGGKLGEEDLIQATSAIAASRFPGVLLLDGPQARAGNAAFLTSFGGDKVVPFGRFVEPLPEFAQPLQVEPGRPDGIWQALLPRAGTVVVCPAEPREMLLQSACLAGRLKAPLFVLREGVEEKSDLEDHLRSWGTQQIEAVGSASRLCAELKGVKVRNLADLQSVQAADIQALSAEAPIRTLVVCNPADAVTNRGRVSVLAPWLALQHHAALLTTNTEGDNVADLMQEAVKNPGLSAVENVILAGTLRALPTEHRANPVAGKDAEIEMEPLTPADLTPFTFAVGRVFHDDLGVVALMMARERLLLGRREGGPKALVVSNPGGGLSLLEAFSRNTVMEFGNRGYVTTARFDENVDKSEIRRLLPEQDIFLWEGHYRTMVDQFGLPGWKEPLRPSLVFLQSCLALNEAEAKPLLQRGAIGVIGSSTRTYSGSGGAFTLAFFDAMMYDHQSLGGSLRQAKNFLLAYTILKEKRLGENAKLAGANLRSAWAFSLWGDPTLHLPEPEQKASALPAVDHEVKGTTIVVRIPENSYPLVTSEKYQAQMRPDFRLAGLVSKEAGDDEKHLVPLVFREVHLRPEEGKGSPQLTTRLPAKQWVFFWDARRKTGYLLIVPRKADREIRFHVAWSG